MYLMFKEYIDTRGGNLSRSNAMVKSVRLPSDRVIPNTLELIKRRFKETYGVIPYIDYMTLDTDDFSKTLKFTDVIPYRHVTKEEIGVK